MQPIIISPKMQRQRKVLLLMPLLITPFITLFFWAFGGGKGTSVKAASTQAGFNMHLPDARLKDQGKLDKMSYYELADKDSARIRQQIERDPYNKNRLLGDSAGRFASTLTGANSAQTAQESPASSEAMVRRKLAELQVVMDRHQPAESPRVPEHEVPVSPAPAATVSAADPEVGQMNVLLEKILDIQHPERLRQPAPSQISAMKPFRGIPALVDGTQRITQGTVIRIKLLDSVTLGGHLFEKDQLIYGSGNLTNQRYLLSVKSIHVGNAFYPVDLTVFDQVDGLEGISVPEAVTSDALREGAAGGVQGMEIRSLDPSMSAQLAEAGINAAKGLFSRKVRQVKGKVKNGHPVLLRINNTSK